MLPLYILYCIGLQLVPSVTTRLSIAGLTKILEHFFRNGANRKNNSNRYRAREMVQTLVNYRLFSIYTILCIDILGFIAKYSF